jgi:hypothetical protein
MHSKICVFVLVGIHHRKGAIMSWKTSVLWGLLAVSSVGFLAGCNEPSNTNKPATSAPPEGPTANTTDSK